jgi:putative ABC transport system ATP-binding protein
LFIITHDAGLAARCARVVEMQDGAILSDTSAASR